MKEKIDKKLSVAEMCLLHKLNQNTKEYMVQKYGDKAYTEVEWKGKLKKDGLDF